MSTTGTSVFNLDINDYIEEAFERCGLGAVVPFDKSWYLPILHKLENQGIVFKEYL